MGRPLFDVEIDFEDLAPEWRARLASLDRGNVGAHRLDRVPSAAPLAALLVGAGILAILVIFIARGAGPFGATSYKACVPWGTSDRVQGIVLGMAAAAFILPAALAWVRRRRAPLGTFLCIAGDHLVDCHHDRVRAYPLARLQMNPEQPAERTLLLLFDGRDEIVIDLRPRGGGSFGETLRRQIEAAVGDSHSRSGGYRGGDDDGPGLDDLAPEGKRRRPGNGASLRTWMGATAIAGCLGALAGGWVLPLVRGAVVEACVLDACRRFDTVEPCADYASRFPAGSRLAEADDLAFRIAARGRLPDLEAYASAFPRGRHIAEIRAARAPLLERAVAGRAHVKPAPGADGARGVETFTRILKALAADEPEPPSAGRTVSLRFSRSLERWRPSREELDRLEQEAKGGTSALSIVMASMASLQGKDPLEILYPDDKMDPPFEAVLPDGEAMTNEKQFAATLERRLDRALPSLGLQFAPRALDEGAARITVDYRVVARRSLIRASSPLSPKSMSSFWELTFHWTVTAVTQRPAVSTERFELVTYPPRDYSCVERKDLYVGQRRAAFTNLAERLLALFGYTVEPDRACLRAESEPPPKTPNQP